jgi:hypothetical protein
MSAALEGLIDRRSGLQNMIQRTPPGGDRQSYQAQLAELESAIYAAGVEARAKTGDAERGWAGALRDHAATMHDRDLAERYRRAAAILVGD